MSLELLEHETIQQDLEKSLKGDLSMSVLLFHVPPYGTSLDMADLDGRMIDHVPLDPHIGSYAVKKLIEERRPYVTLHGHAHETVRLTGKWMDKTGTTFSFSGVSEKDDLAVVSFFLEEPEKAERSVY